MDSKVENRMKCDVLVIGGGFSGAIRAHIADNIATWYPNRYTIKSFYVVVENFY